MNAKIVLDMTSFKISDNNSFSVSVSTIFNIDGNDSQKSVAGGWGGHTPLNSPTDTIRVSKEVEDFNLRNFAQIKKHKSTNKKRKKYKQYKQSNKSQVNGGSL